MTERRARVLFRVGDIAHLRGAWPPLPTIVLAVQPRRVRVGYDGPDGLPVRRWMEPGDLVQATAQYAVQGILEHLQTVREQRS